MTDQPIIEMPRLVVLETEAAHIVGARNIDQFRREVKAGIWPKPIVDSKLWRYRRWSVPQLLARLRPDLDDDHNDPVLDEVERRWGMK